MINITLMIDGKEKTFRAAGVNLGASIEAYNLYRDYCNAQADFSEELLQRCVDFILRLFGRSFSEDDLMNGYRGSAFQLFPSLLNAVVSYVSEEIVNFPEPALTTPAKKAKKMKD